MYCLKILSAYTTILGVQITAYGQTYLSAQGLTCLFLSYAAGLDYDDIEPELSFTVVAMFLSILTLGTNALWVYARVAALTDLLQIFSLLTIVLVGKYRYAVAKRMNLLLNLKLKASQELQDIESAFFFELLEAILPSRLTQNMLENPISFGRLYLELFETVTVIHLDITSFTVMSSNMPPSDLVDLLNMLFTRFDKICQGHNVEKILTIGDAYVAMRMPKSFKGSRTRHLEGHQKIHPSQGPTSAGEHLHYTSQNASDGPNQRSENPGGNSTETVKWDENAEAAMEACIAAVEMQEALKSMIMTWSEERPESGINSDQIGKLRARIGIHTGPAFGCLTGGATKIKYELMGEAMEVSEQIERMAEPGTVRSSLSTMYHVFQGMGLFLNEIMGWECLQASTSFKDGQELISQREFLSSPDAQKVIFPQINLVLFKLIQSPIRQ
ncbi:nucleotide cyclase [Chytridium lagenaria]|nr:nucleotide cyclase [Chytridium lagenaria]